MGGVFTQGHSPSSSGHTASHGHPCAEDLAPDAFSSSAHRGRATNGCGEGGGGPAAHATPDGAAGGPALTSSSRLIKELYAANTLSEGLQALWRVVPVWVPVTGAISAIGLYYITFRARLFLARWRAAERRRAERKYELLDNLRGVSLTPFGGVEALEDDEADEEDEEDEEETAVSMRDVDEFRSSLGIRLPRDEDLLGLVERMLLVDPIPDGWVLYRTTAGIIRYMNLNTQELFFFPPNKRKEQVFIEAELRRRNRQAMESKYSFSYEDEGLNTQTSPLFRDVRGTSQGSTSARGTSAGSGGRVQSPISFAEGGEYRGAEDASQSSAFTRLFHYFLEREQKKIEEDVARAHGGVAAPGTGPATHGGGRGHETGDGGGTSAESSASPRRPSNSITYRVVSSNTIHGSRGGV